MAGFRSFMKSLLYYLLSSNVESKISTSPPPTASYAEVTKSLAKSDSGTHGHMPGGPQVTTSTRPSRSARSENLIVFGLPEVDSLPDLKNSVDELLSFLVGKPIPISDMYHLGRWKVLTDVFVTPHPRPVVLKLLYIPLGPAASYLNCTQAQGLQVKGIFVHEDLSPEEQRKRRKLL